MFSHGKHYKGGSGANKVGVYMSNFTRQAQEKTR